MNERTRSQELFEQAKKLIPGGVVQSGPGVPAVPVLHQERQGQPDNRRGRERVHRLLHGLWPVDTGPCEPERHQSHQDPGGDWERYTERPSRWRSITPSLINKYYPSMEMMRFVNSGTEATMHAIRLARGYTGRKKIIKVEGAFHGSHDAVLVKAGSGATTHSAPDSAGVPEEVTRNTLIVPFNDPEAIVRSIGRTKGRWRP